MTRKQRRSALIGGVVVTLSIAVGLVLIAMRDQVVFFYSPSEVLERKLAIDGTRIRLGGLVEEGSIEGTGPLTTSFAVTDTQASMKVVYKGILPDLFRDGQGVIAEGKLLGDGVFKADVILAKHDENYMPREVADALEKAHAEPADR